MKRYGKQLTAALLALCITLGLAACGGGGDGESGGGANTLSGKVYVPQFMDFKLDIDYIQGGCADEENVYIIGFISLVYACTNSPKVISKSAASFIRK